jgi:hypothetical protein
MPVYVSAVTGSAVGRLGTHSDAEELRSLLAGAGFGGIQIDPASRTARFPDPSGFLAGEIALDTAAIPSMQAMDERDRQAMLGAIREDMEAPLARVTRDDHVVLEFHAHVARARRA